jgi:hypothetical protein
MRSFRDERPRYIRWVRDDAYNAATARRDRARRARNATRASRELWDTDERLNELLPTLTRNALEKMTDDEARRAREMQFGHLRHNRVLGVASLRTRATRDAYLFRTVATAKFDEAAAAVSLAEARWYDKRRRV